MNVNHFDNYLMHQIMQWPIKIIEVVLGCRQTIPSSCQFHVNNMQPPVCLSVHLSPCYLGWHQHLQRERAMQSVENSGRCVNAVFTTHCLEILWPPRRRRCSHTPAAASLRGTMVKGNGLPLHHWLFVWAVWQRQRSAQLMSQAQVNWSSAGPMTLVMSEQFTFFFLNAAISGSYVFLNTPLFLFIASLGLFSQSAALTTQHLFKLL